MSIVSLRNRLAQLEAERISTRPASKPDPLLPMLQVLIAHHLGNAGPADSIAEAVARGLGYDSSGGLMTGLRAAAGAPAAEDFSARWRDATRRLLALRGAAPDCDEAVLGSVVKALFREMPERLQGHPMARARLMVA